MEVKAWLSINFLMKGMCYASYVWGVEIHRICFEIFFYGKLRTCHVPLIKGIILLRNYVYTPEEKGRIIVILLLCWDIIRAT